MKERIQVLVFLAQREDMYTADADRTFVQHHSPQHSLSHALLLLSPRHQQHAQHAARVAGLLGALDLAPDARVQGADEAVDGGRLAHVGAVQLDDPGRDVDGGLDAARVRDVPGHPAQHRLQRRLVTLRERRARRRPMAQRRQQRENGERPRILRQKLEACRVIGEILYLPPRGPDPVLRRTGRGGGPSPICFPFWSCHARCHR